MSKLAPSINFPTNRVIIFGINDLAELATYYLRNDSRYQVIGYTTTKEYRPKENMFQLLPIWSWEDLENYFEPDEYLLFAPLADNKLREKIYNEGLKKGYKFISYISSKATTFNTQVGENCFILEDNTIQPFTKVGNNVVMWSGNHLGHHSIVEDNCFISSHVVISGHCNIKKGAWLGVNSTIRDGVTIGENSIVGMGSVVTKSIPNNETWIGSPAKKKE